MSESSQIFLLILILVILILNIVGIIRIVKYYREDRTKIILNLILIIIVPIFWSLLVILITRKPKESKLKSHYKYLEAGYKNWTRYQ